MHCVRQHASAEWPQFTMQRNTQGNATERYAGMLVCCFFDGNFFSVFLCFHNPCSNVRSIYAHANNNKYNKPRHSSICTDVCILFVLKWWCIKLIIFGSLRIYQHSLCARALPAHLALMQRRWGPTSASIHSISLGGDSEHRNPVNSPPSVTNQCISSHLCLILLNLLALNWKWKVIACHSLLRATGTHKHMYIYIYGTNKVCEYGQQVGCCWKHCCCWNMLKTCFHVFDCYICYGYARVAI